MKKLVFLKFKSPFRNGGLNESNETLGTIHSDTIFSAVSYCAFRLFEDKAKDFVKTFRVSSLMFAFRENEKYDYLVFKPLSFNILKIEKDFKKAKKLNYIPVSRINDIIKDPEILTDESFQKHNNPVEIQRIASNSLDRITNNSNLYFLESVFVKPDYIPYIVADYDSEYENIFISSIKLLGDSGLGADSTRGFGLFEPEFHDVPDYFKAEGRFNLLLSLYYPSKEEITKISDNCIYKVIKRRGHKKDTVETKPTINYLSEGSVLDFKPAIRENMFLDSIGVYLQTSPLVMSFGGDEI